MTFHRAIERQALWTGEMVSVSIAGRRVLLIDLDGEIVAYPDRCRHQGVPLSQGKLAAGVLTCSAHGWQYDARTGQGNNPCGIALTSLAVEVRGADIWVEL